MARSDLIDMPGVVTSVNAGGNFIVKTDKMAVLAKLAGRLRRFKIKVVLGDRVTVSVSPYDPSRGFITYRH